MFYVKLTEKLRSNNKDIYRSVHFSIAESNLNHHIPNVRFLNALIARDTAIQKVFAFIRRDAQETIQPSIVQAGRNPRTLSAKATI